MTSPDTCPAQGFRLFGGVLSTGQTRYLGQIRGPLQFGEPLGRSRSPGGGRKSVTETDPGVVEALLGLVEPGSRGDPESPLRWTTLSLRNLAAELGRAGHKVSAPTVARLLREEHFGLQGNARAAEGRQHPDRDAQFRYLC